MPAKDGKPSEAITYYLYCILLITNNKGNDMSTKIVFIEEEDSYKLAHTVTELMNTYNVINTMIAPVNFTKNIGMYVTYEDSMPKNIVDDTIDSIVDDYAEFYDICLDAHKSDNLFSRAVQDATAAYRQHKDKQKLKAAKIAIFKEWRMK